MEIISDLLEFVDPVFIEHSSRILTATLLGVVLGTERAYARKTAGMRTYALVALGSSLFVIISIIITQKFVGVTNFDPLRMAAHIITGIGFIGAGLIVFRKEELHGLTTAAGLWVTAAIGITAGFGLYSLAIFSTIVTLFVFTLLWYIESEVKKASTIEDVES